MNINPLVRPTSYISQHSCCRLPSFLVYHNGLLTSSKIPSSSDTGTRQVWAWNAIHTVEAFKMGCPEWPQFLPASFQGNAHLSAVRNYSPPSPWAFTFTLLLTWVAPNGSHPNLHCYFLQINQKALTQGPKQVKSCCPFSGYQPQSLGKCRTRQALCKHLRRSKLGDIVSRGLIWQTVASGRMRCEEMSYFQSMFSLLTRRFFLAPHSFILTNPIKELKIFNKGKIVSCFTYNFPAGHRRALLLPCSVPPYSVPSTLLTKLLEEADSSCKEGIIFSNINTMEGRVTYRGNTVWH